MRILFFLVSICGLLAQAAEPPLDVLKDVGIEPALGAQLSLDTPLQNEQGKIVPLSDFFDGKKPVALVLNYYGCPMLCGVLLNAARDSFLASDWKMGEHYRVVTISFDSSENAELAAAKKESILASIKDLAARQAARENWHFLVGKADSIAKITKELGFRYKWVPAEKQFAHGAAMYFLSPHGKISRVLLGMNFPAKDFKFALLEASEGKVGTLAEKLVSFCYHYDPKGNTYAILATQLMKIGGAIMVTAFLIAYLLLFLRKRKGNPDV